MPPYLPRTLESFARTASTQFPVTLVTGSRQVGKTTFLRRLSDPSRVYVTLDDPLVLNLARRDPALFVARYRPPLLIDEIQYAPELLPYIKIEVDIARTAGLFWLTGSQQFHVMRDVSESLAGRVAVLHLMGLSEGERQGRGASLKPFLPDAAAEETLRSTATPGVQELYLRIWRGSYPGIAANDEMDRDLFYSSYVQTYLQRDVRGIAGVRDELSFLTFLRVAAARTGQLLNLSDLARDADVTVNTAKGWMSVLQASGIVYLLSPFHTNLTKRLVKSPKLYFLDTGLCAYLTQWSSAQTLEAGAMSGAILESWVISEILKSYLHNGKDAPLYFYRTKDGTEVDLLIVRDGVTYPVEIKKTASPSASHTKALESLRGLDTVIGQGALICLVSQILPLSRDVTAIPAGNV